MEYQHKIIIELPRDIVAKELLDPSNYEHWQKGLQSQELVEGVKGEEGSKTRLAYSMGNRDIVMTETIVATDLPRKIRYTYDSSGVWNQITHTFENTDDGNTHWISHNIFKAESFMMKIFMWIMPGSFKKQSKIYMEDFKQFIESKYAAQE